MIRRNIIPCGCRTCGCICEEHSGFSVTDPCPRHVTRRYSWGWDLAAIAASSLFLGCGFVWIAILSTLVPA